MKQYISLLVILLFITGCSGPTGKEYKNYRHMPDSEMKRCPEGWMIDFSTQPAWNYCHGLVTQSILQAWQASGEAVYYAYVYQYADQMIDEEGNIISYDPEDYNIDKINTGKILFPLYANTKEVRFKKAIQRLRDQMLTHPRTANGSFWHKKVYPHQVWLDGIYMACPFLAEYAVTFNEPELLDDVTLQILDCHKHMVDAATGLYYHGWDESRQQRWSDPQTGLSPNFWSRSIGWYMMSMIDVLDFLPATHPEREQVVTIFRNLSGALENFRDPETGMWYQVTDQGEREGNYLESTGSAMFIYSWIKGAQKGYLDEAFLEKGTQAYEQYIKTFIREEADGTLSVSNCCSVSGLGGDKRYRDGSFEYYISELVRDNDPKAVGPFIMMSILLDR